ncbi:MAG: NAD(P)H-binding protein [Treponema sp.]|nr:NAD(P)H-binding protein [Treponema sp.]
MKIFMVGGTGLLGSEAARQLIEKGHEVTSLSLRGVPDGSQVPDKMKLEIGNYMKLSEEDIARYLKGMDGFIFAAGIDERVNGEYPVYDLFKRFNIDPLEKFLTAAKKEGVKHCVVLGSYFSYFSKEWPELKLYENNPYIRSRVDQENMALGFADETMSVGVLQLPYIFGIQKGRKPVWTILVGNVLSMAKSTMYPPGGTTMVTVRQVGECVAGALEKTEKGKTYPVGYFNLEWTEMLKIFHEGMGCPEKKIITIPAFLFTLSQIGPYKKMRKSGKESGLNMVNFSKAMSRNMFIDKSVIVNELGVTDDNIKSAILDSVRLSMDSIKGQKLVEMVAAE